LKVDEEIKKVNSAIEKCEGEIKIASSNVLQSTGEDKQYWMANENALRAKKIALMAEKNALRADKKPVNEANILQKYSNGI
jgi:hypothetical protein